MNILIVEDEKLAREYLIDLLNRLPINIRIVGQADSVKEGIKWLLKHESPDLILMDINLGDGLGFKILDVVDVQCPIIFTTAYDEYAIQAFKVNSIDYLLKPIDTEDLRRAFAKFKSINADQRPSVDYRMLNQRLRPYHKERFIVKIGSHLKTIPNSDILFFNSENKTTYITSKKGRQYPIDYSLEKLIDLLNPDEYFRINRQYVIKYNAIEDIVSFSNSRLKIHLVHSKQGDVFVARDRVPAFKAWLDK